MLMKSSNSLRKNFLNEMVNLNSKDLTDFEKIKAVLNYFNSFGEYKSENLSEIQLKKIKILVQSSYYFKDDFNLQIRFINIAKKFSDNKIDLQKINLLIPIIITFKNYWDKDIFLEIFIDIFLEQVNYKQSKILIRSEGIFEILLDAVKLVDKNDFYISKSFDLLYKLYDEENLKGEKEKVNWMIKSAIILLLSSHQEILKPEIVFRHLVHLSKFRLFSLTLIENIYFFIQNFKNHRKSVIEIFENAIGTAKNDLLFVVNSLEEKNRIFNILIESLLINPVNQETFLKTLNIIQFFSQILPKDFFSEEIINKMMIVIKKRADSSLIFPSLVELLQVTSITPLIGKPSILVKCKNGEKAFLNIKSHRNIILNFPNYERSLSLRRIFRVKFELNDNTNSNEFFDLENETEIRLEMDFYSTKKDGEIHKEVLFICPTLKNLEILNPIIEVLLSCSKF